MVGSIRAVAHPRARTAGGETAEKPKPGPQRPAKPNAETRVPELDGIRAIAIWGVLLGHGLMRWSDGSIIRESFRGPLAAVAQIIGHGWLGVDLFFVLSGFLITGILLDRRARPDFYQNFYRRRALRILPVFLVVISILAVVDRGPASYFALALFFCANFAHALAIPSALGAGPLWSLAVEEQFYLLWPTFVRRLSRRWLTVIAIALVILPAVLRFGPTTDERLELTWLRCDGLAFGALAALLVRSRSFVSWPPRSARAPAFRVALAVLGVTLLLGVIELFAHSKSLSNAIRITQADALFFAAIVLAYTLRGSAATAFLRSRLMRFFADTSYCAYLIHLPMLIAVEHLALIHLRSPLSSLVMNAVIAYILTFSLAVLSRRYLELPFLRAKSRLRVATIQ